VPKSPGREKVADTVKLRVSETGDESVVRLAICLMSPNLKFGRADRKILVVRVLANLPDFGT
jgi:hypothetical protein